MPGNGWFGNLPGDSSFVERRRGEENGRSGRAELSCCPQVIGMGGGIPPRKERAAREWVKGHPTLSLEHHCPSESQG